MEADFRNGTSKRKALDSSKVTSDTATIKGTSFYMLV